jgi:hypothetical protein
MALSSAAAARPRPTDGATAYYIREIRGEDEFLAQLRADLQVLHEGVPGKNGPRRCQAFERQRVRDHRELHQPGHLGVRAGQPGDLDPEDRADLSAADP